MLSRFKKLYKLPSPQAVAAQELAAAELDKLAAQTRLEQAKAEVDYNTARITRLRKYLNDTTEPTT